MLKIDIKNTLDETVETIDLGGNFFVKNVFNIGRTAECEIMLNDISVSRQHAKLEIATDHLILTDTESSGGIFFEETMLPRNQNYKIASGSTYRFGPFDLTIYYSFDSGQSGIDQTVLRQDLPNDFQPVADVMDEDWEVWSGEKTALICTNIYNETHDVKTFTFAATANTIFRYKPGQFVTLHLTIDDQNITRSYTISSSPSQPHSISNTIKRTQATNNNPEGLVSNWLHDNLKIGDSIDISGSYGEFSCHSHRSNMICLISGGSGITPMLSMVKWICDTAAKVDVIFIHVAKTEKDIIARQELEILSTKHKNLRLIFTLTRVENNNRWSGYTGRLTNELLVQAVPDLQLRRIFVCGPAPFMSAIKLQMKDSGFDMDQFHEESFGGKEITSSKTNLSNSKTDTSLVGFGLQAVIENIRVPTLDSKESENQDKISTSASNEVHFLKSGINATSNASGESILEMAESAGLTLPFGCRQGMCGTCKAKKTNGNIKQDEYDDSILSDADREEGYILLCIGKPEGSVSVDV